MLGAQFYVRTVSSFGAFTDQTNATPPIASSLRPSSSSFHSPIRLDFRAKRRSSPKSFVVDCSSASGSSGAPYSHGEDHHSDFLEASLLVSETISHYRMLRRGFSEEMKWPSTGKMHPFSAREREPGAKFTAIGQGFLSRFQSPTIFLKISCDGDFLLPIIVGEFAIEKLIDSFLGDNNMECPDQFHFLKNVVERLGYQVKLVRITERVINTYFAKIYFNKPGDNDVVSVDVRPSDAINLANRCKAPIYVNKHIVLTDAVRIGYGMGRVQHGKSTYDVLLDSAADGPDILTEELNLVQNMNLAVKEERYTDAAMWRDKLMELRNSRCDR